MSFSRCPWRKPQKLRWKLTTSSANCLRNAISNTPEVINNADAIALIWNLIPTRQPSFGKSSYYFGTNIPGKPRRYLLNAGGRPKLFKEIDRVRDTDYEAFVLIRTET